MLLPPPFKFGHVQESILYPKISNIFHTISNMQYPYKHNQKGPVALNHKRLGLTLGFEPPPPVASKNQILFNEMTLNSSSWDPTEFPLLLMSLYALPPSNLVFAHIHESIAYKSTNIFRYLDPCMKLHVNEITRNIQKSITRKSNLNDNYHVPTHFTHSSRNLKPWIKKKKKEKRINHWC